MIGTGKKVIPPELPGIRYLSTVVSTAGGRMINRGAGVHAGPKAAGRRQSSTKSEGVYSLSAGLEAGPTGFVKG
jgi:hypothetical protein